MLMSSQVSFEPIEEKKTSEQSGEELLVIKQTSMETLDAQKQASMNMNFNAAPLLIKPPSGSPVSQGSNQGDFYAFELATR